MAVMKIRGKDGKFHEVPSIQGEPGATPNITIGTVETVPAGSDAGAEITGETPNLKMNLRIPRGNDGVTPVKGTDYFTDDEIQDVAQQAVASMLVAKYSFLAWFGGSCYITCEVFYRSKSHWSMLVVAVILSMVIERCGAECPWEMTLPLQALLCTVAITAAELVAGLVINVWLGLGVWDYSHLPANFMGQICLWFSMLWHVLSLVFVPVFDVIKYLVKGGDKPHYSFF